MEPARRLLGPPPNLAVAVVGLVVTLLAAVGLSIGYTARAVHRSDQQWCELLRGIDVPLPSASPATQRTLNFARQVHALRLEKGCR